MANSSANANVNVRVDSDVKNQAQDIFSSLGMDMSTAINIFLRQCIRKNGIPFELVTEPTNKRHTPHITPHKFGASTEKTHEATSHYWFEPSEDYEE